ncbi:MAG: hypothetical protein RL398_3413, partial [Planctomycetota bacterium]
MRPLARLLPASAALLGAATAAAQAAGAPDFTTEVRPLLSRHCFACHGPDEAGRKSGLRLDVRDEALFGGDTGRAAIVPGDAAASELVRRIHAHDDEQMPPASANKPLDEAGKALLVRWIDAGAEYRTHWAFVPPVEPPLPPVRDAAWARSPIDRFVQARLEREGLTPSAEADRWTLVRRVYLDLIGMPPSEAEAREFVADAQPDAYERLVDRLLAMPQYGERWARRWLDLARYADTNGYEKDRNRSIWPWRDWVVDALNRDLPFDRFTIEQLAGDMLPNATPDQIVATGFHRNTMLNEEGGIDPLEFRFHALTDRVATTGTAWLGLTLGCAQCHTHKYDPITQREYYAVMACLDDADEVDYALPDAAKDALVASARQRAQALLASVPDTYPLEPTAWLTAEVVTATARSGEPQRQADGSWLFAPPGDGPEEYTLVLETESTAIAALRLEALTDDSLPKRGPGHAPNGNFVLSGIEVTAEPRDAAARARQSAPERVAIAAARADAEQSGFAVAAAIDGKFDRGWAVDAGDGRLNRDHEAVFTFAQPISHPGGSRLVVKLHQRYGGKHMLGKVRVTLGAASAIDPAARRTACDAAFAAFCASERARATEWNALRPTAAVSNLPRLQVLDDDSIYASGDTTKSDTYELTLPAPPRGTTALRLEVLPDARLPAGGPGLCSYEGPRGDFFLGELELLVDGTPVAMARASESHGKNNFGSAATAALAIDGDPQTGWSTADRPGERHVAVFVLREPLATERALTVRMRFGRHYACSLGRFRWSATTRVGGADATSMPEDVERALLAGDDLAGPARDAVFAHFVRTAPQLAAVRAELRAIERPPARTTTLVFAERPADHGRTTRVHRRGEYLQPGDEVQPGAIETVLPFGDERPRNRLGLAQWLVSPDNPLTARVAVNRAWQALFGRGLVRTLGDFGLQGEAPSHPELLDWLAVDFVRNGWSQKRLHRQLVLSATYRQASTASAELSARDPDNRL